jgi:hypothetical protein
MMSLNDWRLLARSVAVGKFAIPIKFTVRDQGFMVTLAVTLGPVADIGGGLDKVVEFADSMARERAEQMDHGEAAYYIRKRIELAVMHELSEWLIVDGRRNDPHARRV